MAVRFKFRSSPNFDTIDIGQQPSISIRDLKSKIVLKNHLNLSHGFDLVFCDSISGTEYTDENTRIASGSSVIVKRVPAKSCPSPREFDIPAAHVDSGDAYLVNADAHYVNADEPPVLDFGVNECDDFGVDLCPPPVANLSDYYNLAYNFNDKRDSLSRRAVAAKNAEESFEMPLELKCPLCTTAFKEAVMIPCCQHSFCESCIHLALVQNSRCPMCSSTKCKPEDLLPNLSLRQTIKRFLESQDLNNGLEKDLDRYAPDGESGIQTRQLSYAPTVQPRDLRLNRCATRVSDKLQSNTKRYPVALDDCTEFQGENEPLRTSGANEEANSSTKKGQTFCDVTEGGERNFITPGRLNKGLRTCYRCGSPDHLIRDCPAAASSHTSDWCGNVPFQGGFPGYAPQYWPGNSQHGRPLYDMYCGPEMMYNTNMAATTPYAFSPYTSSMFTGYQVTSGSLQPGGMGLVSGIIAPQMNQSNLPGLMGCARQQRIHSEAFEREAFDQDHNANGQLDNAERGLNHSGDSFTRRSERNHRSHERSDDDKYSNGKRQERVSRSSEGGRNLRNAQLDESTSEKHVPDSRSRPPVERHKNFFRSSKRQEDMREQRESDSNQNHHHSNRKSTQLRRDHERRSRREFDSHLQSGLEPTSSSDGRHRRDEPGPKSKHSKPNGKDLYHEHGKVKKYSYDDYGEDSHPHKRKRYY
ncbi:uncharacterized protein LOC141612051 [Silene latifolia]|uniref:uncharacterized protein LOC141612051 n=1 Tax=Silene latifolia TaxID=37657 RepID=UPI003D77C44A